MAAAPPMMQETVWFDQSKIEKAETQYQEHLAQTKYGTSNSPAAPAAQSTGGAANVDQTNRIEKLEKENKDLRKMIDGLCNRIKKLEVQMGSVDTTAKPVEQAKPAAKQAPAPADDSDDEDLFGSDSDDEEAEKLAEETKKANKDAKEANKKAAPIGKSTIIFAIKGWDDETDFVAIEKHIRGIEHVGLRWGAEGKLEPVAYGVQKLLMNAIVVDDECGTDFLEEAILEMGEDFIQSVDIVAFNKI